MHRLHMFCRMFEINISVWFDIQHKLGVPFAWIRLCHNAGIRADRCPKGGMEHRSSNSIVDMCYLAMH